MSFKNHYKSLEVPVVVYADFESIRDPVTKEHTVCSFGYYVKSRIPQIQSSREPVIYFGTDTVEAFLTHMKDLSYTITNAHVNTPMTLTPEDYKHIATQTQCHIC